MSTSVEEWVEQDRGMGHYGPHMTSFVPEAVVDDDGGLHDGFVCVECGARKQILTSERRIAKRLRNAHEGEEFTVEVGTERRNREVQYVRDDEHTEYVEVQFGDPDGPHYGLCAYDDTVVAYTLTDDPDSPLSRVGTVTKLYDWEVKG